MAWNRPLGVFDGEMKRLAAAVHYQEVRGFVQ
jgi:hypothetical protein